MVISLILKYYMYIYHFVLYSVDTGNPQHPFPSNTTLDLVRLRLTEAREAPDTITVPSVMYELYTLMFSRVCANLCEVCLQNFQQ